jgi:DNA mismatch repair protein MutS
MSVMIDQYFQIYTEKQKEYGENTVVLFACGSFMEIYEIDNNNEKIGNAKRLSNILNMVYTNKSGDITKNSRTYPNFIGFTMSVLNKYLQILLRNGFTVVLVEQLESSAEKKGKLVKRGVTKIYSPSLLPSDFIEGEFNLVSMLFDINAPVKKSNKKNSSSIQKMNVSICCINNNNNITEVTDNEFTFLPNDSYTLNLSLENISRILYRCNPKELQIGFLNEMDGYVLNEIKSYFDNNYENTMYNTVDNLYKNKMYQNKYLKDVYEHINFGIIEPIEYFELSKELSIINLLFTLNFIEKHDVSYIKNLSIPKNIIEDNFLILELNTLVQLNILSQNSSKCLFDIIDYTKTAIGKRHLKSLLCKPFKDHNIINKRYIITDSLRGVLNIDSILSNILDIEKLHRKMGISELHQFEFVKLNENYIQILQLIEILNDSKELKELILDEIFDINTLNEFKKYIKEYGNTFDLCKMKKFNLNSGKDELENYFNRGVIKELDIIQDKISELELKRKELRLELDNLINNDKKTEYVKIIYTEFEGYSFTCTKIRYECLLKKLNKKVNWKVKQTNSSVKFIPEELEKLSTDILINRELLSSKISINYKNILLEYYRKNNIIFNKLKHLIEIIDVCNSNLKCSEKLNYTRPKIIKSTDESYLDVESIRHPIIESLGKEYIPNDITLDNNTNGVLCYGLNSSGKSTLLRAIGIAVIMSQCGLFVAAKSFKFSPFDTLISQVDLTDNIFTGKSSFITEMMGLKRILQCAGKNTLVLMDELSKGTEHNSSTALVSSVILELIKSSTKFFFTSHLHEIPKVQDIIDLENKLKICHLSVNIKNNNIIYERKLKNGQGSDLYGLEVSNSLLECPELIKKAYDIRNKLIGNDKKIKKSVYNAKKIIDKCQICSSTKQLETDHIQKQCTADEKGFLDDTRHKNHISNLCILCHECHLNKTLGKIKINGYVESINGKFLDWEKIE